MLDQLVIQKRHPALDRCRHAHLILLHQQFYEIGLQVGMAHAIQCIAGAFLVVA